MKRTTVARRRDKNRKILFSSSIAQSFGKRTLNRTTVPMPASLKSNRSQEVTPSIIRHSSELPSRAFLVEFCYKHWAQWTEDTRLEILRMQQEIMGSASHETTHEQRMTLLNVELLYARLNQVKERINIE